MSNKNKKYSVKDQTVLVTGGAGFIGSHLAIALLKEGVKKVKIIDKQDFHAKETLPHDPRVEFIKFNLGTDDASLLKTHLKDVAFVFHLAAEKHNQPIRDPQKTIQSNIVGMHDLLEAAIANNVKKIVFSSTLYAYGRMTAPDFKETDIPEPNTIYGVSKVTGEHLLRYLYTKFGIEFNVLRYLFVYGPKQWTGTGYKSVIVSNFEKIINQESPTVFGDGKQTLDYIYVDDVVEATILAMQSEHSGGTFNVSTGNGVAVLDLIDLMQKIAHNTTEKTFLPADATHNTYRVADPSHMKKILGFSAKTSLKDGLQKTFDWISSPDNRP